MQKKLRKKKINKRKKARIRINKEIEKRYAPIKIFSIQFSEKMKKPGQNSGIVF